MQKKLPREYLCTNFAAIKRCSMIDKNEIMTLKAVLLYIINVWNGTQKCDVYHIVKAAFYAQEFHLQSLELDKVLA
jgi:hypothetical protein